LLLSRLYPQVSPDMAERGVMADFTFDEDGYPTDESLDIITKWPLAPTDTEGWFAFIKSGWTYRDVGYWTESMHTEERVLGDQYQYAISTGGWSGNESIIMAMQENRVLWSITWEMSANGGHYIFRRSMAQEAALRDAQERGIGYPTPKEERMNHKEG